MNRLFFILMFGLFCFSSDAQSMYDMPKGVQTRWASPENWKGAKGAGGIENGGRKGSAMFPIKAGEIVTLAEVSQTSGVVRRIWITINDRSSEMIQGLKIKMYWDGTAAPAVSCPLSEFFNQGLGRMTTFENDCFSSPEGRSFNCFIPMPFKTSMKIELCNETKTDLRLVFYDVNYTIGDPVTENTLYFHAFFNKQYPTELKKDYEILPKVKGRGRFLGTNINVVVNQEQYSRIWWGEGEVKMYLDGDDKYPTLCGTGTEDYIGSAWSQGLYCNRYQGCTIADEKTFEYSFYRYHIPDPVYFYEDIRVTIQQIGNAMNAEMNLLKNLKTTVYNAGEKLEPVDFDKQTRALFERTDNVSSCAYYYLDQPGSPFNEK
jgi:hypothetical protein